MDIEMIDRKKIVCIIPARGGSKGLKKKNVKLLGGKPLIAWTIDEAGKSKFIDRIIVSTEDKEIANISKEHNAEVIVRPDELAQDTSLTIDVVFHVIDKLKENDYIPDYILLLQCTSPLRTVIHIDEAIQKFLDNRDHCDSLISVSKVEHPPWWYKKIDSDGRLIDFIEYDKAKFVRRQDFPEVYDENGAIFIAKKDILYKYRDFETDRTIPYMMDTNSSLDIDTEIDFLLVEHILKSL